MINSVGRSMSFVVPRGGGHLYIHACIWVCAARKRRSILWIKARKTIAKIAWSAAIGWSRYRKLRECMGRLHIRDNIDSLLNDILNSGAIDSISTCSLWSRYRRPFSKFRHCQPSSTSVLLLHLRSCWAAIRSRNYKAHLPLWLGVYSGRPECQPDAS